MRPDRRDILRGGAALSLAAALPRSARAQGAFAPQPGKWRSFEVVTRLEIPSGRGATQAWVPVPSVNEPAWFRSGETVWKTNAKAALVIEAKYGASFVHAQWADGEAAAIEVVSAFSTQDRAIDLTRPGHATLSGAERALYTAPTRLIPTDGIVKSTSDRITAGAASDVDKARRIHDWIVDNTYRKASTRGCGIGDIVALLQSGDRGGKCADLNALTVGLLRAAGIPARDAYGVRVAPSRFGYKSLGAGSTDITRAQHCRAEVFLAGFGWVPIDPADVRKVVLEEPPTNLAMNDPKVTAARATLFGAWEGNWLAYNFAHDVVLPGAAAPVDFLMYPQAETAAGRLDCLDPETFRYTITAREVTAA
ncbi:MAG TPA: transglutaminase domain-containing protein [Xanthobacteraceae bacterium]|nr:transglutaminase domain-containing protein [Xanthobacteraceae bacterium]